MSKLTTEAALAERFGIPVGKLQDLRQRERWPHVRLGRFEIRFTESQIAAIIASHTVHDAAPTLAQRTGLTERSAQHLIAGGAS